MTGHTMTIDFTDTPSQSAYSITCNEPPEALCRAQWDCDCEYYDAHGVDEQGRPWHELSDGYMTVEQIYVPERPRHYGRPGGDCTYRMWVGESDAIDELGSGEVTFPIDLTWTGDEYAWRVTS